MSLWVWWYQKTVLNRDIFTRASMEKCISLLKSNNKNILLKSSKFICFAMIRRNKNINRWWIYLQPPFLYFVFKLSIKTKYLNMQKHGSLWFSVAMFMSKSNKVLKKVMYIFCSMHVLVVCKPVIVCKCMCVCVCKCWCESVCGVCNWITFLYLNTINVLLKGECLYI